MASATMSDWAQEASRVAARNAVLRYGSRASIQKPGRQKSKKTKRSSKLTGAGITVDTNVSRHRGRVPRQVFPNPNPRQHVQKDSKLGGSSMSNRSLWPDPAHTRTTQAKRPTAGEGVDTLRRSQREKDTGTTLCPSSRHNTLPEQDVSPSDRPITIGISIPSEKFAVHATSPYSGAQEASEQKASQVVGRDRRESNAMTPTIIITPAKENFGLTSVNDGLRDDRRTRRSSSIYSTSTPCPSGSVGYVPPIPSLSRPFGSPGLGSLTGNGLRLLAEGVEIVASITGSRRDSSMTTFEEDEHTKKDGRVRSTYTVFEEDLTPASGPGKPPTYTVRNSVRASNETALPTPMRANGWWNFITTPFSTRSNTRLSWSGNSNSSDDMEAPILEKAAGISTSERSMLAAAVSVDVDTSDWDRSPDSSCSDSFHLESALTDRGLASIDSALHGTHTAPLESWKEVSTQSTTGCTQPGIKNFPTFISVGAHSPTKASMHLSARQSQQTTVSPDDREIPIILGDIPMGNQIGPDAARLLSLSHSPPATQDLFVYHMRFEPSLEQRASSVGCARLCATRDERETLANNSTAHEEVVRSPLSNDAETPVLCYATLGTFPNMHSKPSISNTVHVHSVTASKSPISTSVITITNTDQTRADIRLPTPPPAYSPKPSMSGHNESERPRLPRAMSVHLPQTLRQKGRRPPRKASCWHRNRCACIVALVVGILALASAVLVAVMLTRRHNPVTPTQPRWFNLTGFPPMPTGISTVAMPDVLEANSGCVFPSTLWSCALPKEDQLADAPNKPDQPNFRLEIRFRNDTIVDRSLTVRLASRHFAGGARRALPFGRARLLHNRDASFFTSTPAPPNLDDQRFLGNTTDGISQPFEGEMTPFYVTLLNAAVPLANLSPLRKRQGSENSTGSFFPDLQSRIPPPAVNPDGTAAPANLSPYPIAQPIRLYNRGQPTEHYGFYTYFDRSIFLKSIDLLDSNRTAEVTADQNGGAPFSAARFRCTWSQTRFLIQIWTRGAGKNAAILKGPSTTATQSSGNATLFANDFSRPGSFPYPVTVTLDRHGGTASAKSLYCYGLDDQGHPVLESRRFTLENRAFSGNLLNPASGPFGNGTDSEDIAPIDGGTGGCSCRWANWIGVN